MIVETAPAKLNLSLQVVGRRADGYHLLDGLVAFADIGDVVTAEAADATRLALEGPFAAGLSAGPDNLVLRAAAALSAVAPPPRGAALRLVKNLPIASGIGGGSADAAAVLRALQGLWRINVSPSQLQAIAARLGADVPMCVASQPCWIAGVGEEIDLLPDLPEAGLILANPGIPLATPLVFQRRIGGFSAPKRFAIPPTAAALAQSLAATDNDLTAAAEACVPEIAALRRSLASLPGALLARMSGSGATCFALFGSRAAAVAALAPLKSAIPGGWWAAAGGWHKGSASAVVARHP
jgi:4-diphosphocytidyl-2-C-methyl-D-erythritol kinase